MNTCIPRSLSVKTNKRTFYVILFVEATNENVAHLRKTKSVHMKQT